MSGGSYNYLGLKELGDLFPYTYDAELESAIVDLRRFSAPGAGDDLQALYDRILAARTLFEALAPAWADLAPLVKALEWWQSGDTSEADFKAAVRKYLKARRDP